MRHHRGPRKGPGPVAAGPGYADAIIGKGEGVDADRFLSVRLDQEQIFEDQRVVGGDALLAWRGTAVFRPVVFRPAVLRPVVIRPEGSVPGLWDLPRREVYSGATVSTWAARISEGSVAIWLSSDDGAVSIELVDRLTLPAPSFGSSGSGTASPIGDPSG